jgi:hypothetical protein
MRPFLFGVLSMLVVVGLLYLLQPEPQTPAQDPRIESLQSDIDSLDALLAERPKSDTVYLTRYRTIEAKTDSAKAEAAALPPLEAVKLFSVKTGTDSIEMLPDTTAKVSIPTIKKANELLIEGEGNAAKVAVLTDHLAAKDTTIALQAVRITTSDSLAAVTKAQHSRDLAAVKAEAKKQRRTKNLFIGTTAILFLSMFF